MKQYLLRAAGTAAIVSMMAGSAFAQDDKVKEVTVTGRATNSSDVIVIRPKVNTDTKLNIEIKGIDIKINGKPIEEFNDDNVSISRRKDVPGPGRDIAVQGYTTRFRGGTAYSTPRNSITVNGYPTNSNKAFLGVGTEKVENGEGVSITSVSDESAAEKAGLKEDDIITKINDEKINSPEELTKAIGKFKPDDKISITYKRDKKEQKATAVLTKRKETAAYSINTAPFEAYNNFNFDDKMGLLNWTGKPRLGLKAQETEDGKGLKVLDIDDESTAEKAGIKEGDIITSFDGTEVNSVEKLGELAKSAISKGNFKVKVTRDGKPQELEVKIPKKLKTTSL